MISWEYVVGAILLYTAIAIIVQKREILPDYFNIWGPILTIRSQKGLDTIEKLANKYKKFWIPWGNLGVIASIMTAFVGVFFVLVSVYGIISQPQDIGIQGPSDMVVIPGFNRFLPLSAAPEIILGLTIGMIVHEGGHAILCRVGDINVKSTGVIFGALIPLGAFVEPDEESSEKADLKSQLRMFAAGIMNNYAIFVVSIIGLFLTVSLLVSPALGIGVSAVLDDSPAERMGVVDGDRITAVDNETIESQEQFQSLIADGGDTVTINEEKTVDIEGSAYVTQLPLGYGLELQDTILEVNGERIHSPDELTNKMKDSEDTHVDLTLENGEEVNFPSGTYITAQKSDTLTEEMNLDVGDSTFVFEVNGERVYDRDDLIEKLSNNDSVEITYLSKEDDEVVTKNITLSEYNDSISASNNVSGLSTSLLGINVYPAEQFYNTLTPGDSIWESIGNIFGLLLLPLASLTPGIESNFPGFTPFIQNFYEMSSLVPEFSTSFVYFSINVLFWSAWMNFNLAIFNCIPTFALDGGHILRASTELIFENKFTESQINTFVNTIKFGLLISLLIILIIPVFI